MADNSEDEEILLFLLLLRRRRRRKRACNRKIWSKSWILRRASQGACDNLVRELAAEDPAQFRDYHRLDRRCFEDVLSMVNKFIVKKSTKMRSSISPRDRLTVTLRFLATGKSLVLSIFCQFDHY